ncbi:hypothetical protein ANN_27994 [Periplaneta americana]|uniref:Uncharacterized protein n=1 Tax=Periplaneta americana TaxID=6978 RepID=A0ABQ8RUG7_PERAM|nr:hypothetical protein ANN_27994 [Periplaneta americana]
MSNESNHLVLDNLEFTEMGPCRKPPCGCGIGCQELRPLEWDRVYLSARWPCEEGIGCDLGSPGNVLRHAECLEYSGTTRVETELLVPDLGQHYFRYGPMAGIYEGGNEPPGSLKVSEGRMAGQIKCEYPYCGSKKSSHHSKCFFKIPGIVRVTMDVIKAELEVDPLSLETSDNTDEDEKKPILEERNLVDQPVTGIKQEYVDQSHDLTSEIKFEEDPEPQSFPVVKREPEPPEIPLLLVPQQIDLVEVDMLKPKKAVLQEDVLD